VFLEVLIMACCLPTRKQRLRIVGVLVQSLGSRDLWIQAAGVPFWIVTALPFARCWPHSAATGDRQTESGEREPEPLVESRWTPEISYYFPK
jgi:hypothetical protein